ncbi:MAG: response regulator [Candidatus Latescibacterota bacterium]
MSYNVLVVDDSKTARMMLAKTLRISGLQINEVFMAENGARALEILQENWIDLVLTDLHMPVMSGMDMVEKMAADGLLSSLPVVVITSDASQQRMKELQEHGIRDYLCKPVRPEHVKKTIEDILKGTT